MNLIQQAEAVYRDIEKIYKLLGIYSGDMRQFDRQISFIDTNLSENLRKPVEPRFAFTFDFLMTVVYFEGQEIYRSDKPEYTLGHALFTEGIKSLVVKTSLKADELVSWLLKVRRFLESQPLNSDEEGRAGKEDLASVLWKENSPHIQVALYNNLVSFEGLSDLGSAEDADEEVFDEEWEAYKIEFLKSAGELKPDLWRNRDEQWSLPSGDLVGGKVLAPLDHERAANRLKQELADVSFSEKARRILQFSPDELESLKSELSHFDVNQIDFNLIVQLLMSCEIQSAKASISQRLENELIKEVSAILNRFHAPLMLYILRRVLKWKSQPDLKNTYDKLIQEIRESLKSKEMAEQLAEAFRVASRAELASSLLGISSKETWLSAFEVLAQDKQREAEARLLQALIDRGISLIDFIFEWKPFMITEVLSVLPDLQLANQDEIYDRALHSGHPEVRIKALGRIAYVPLSFERGKVLFQKMPLKEKQIFLDQLLQAGISDNWTPFVKDFLSGENWRKLPSGIQSSALQLILKYFQSAALEELKPFVKARRYFFVIRYPVERESILTACMSCKEKSVKNEILSLIAEESRVWMQNPILKSRLKGFV